MKFTEDHEWLNPDAMASDVIVSASPTTPPTQLGDVVFRRIAGGRDAGCQG
jgi:hypothetical protein